MTKEQLAQYLAEFIDAGDFEEGMTAGEITPDGKQHTLKSVGWPTGSNKICLIVDGKPFVITVED